MKATKPTKAPKARTYKSLIAECAKLRAMYEDDAAWDLMGATATVYDVEMKAVMKEVDRLAKRVV